MSMTKLERMIRVNALAVQAKWNPSVIPELYELVERWIYAICRRYCRPDGVTRVYEFEDLCQSAFLGFMKAIDAYDPDCGAFSVMLKWQVQHTCRAEVGLRGKREPLYDALSLNKPLSDDDDDIEHIDILTDPDAEKPFEVVTDHIYNAELRSALDKCMAQMPQEHADILRARYYDGVKLKDLGKSKESARQAIGKALKEARKPKSIKWLKGYTRQDVINKSYNRFEIGYKQFCRTWYSSVERAAEVLVLKRFET